MLRNICISADIVHLTEIHTVTPRMVLSRVLWQRTTLKVTAIKNYLGINYWLFVTFI